jgi:hypothetical protein
MPKTAIVAGVIVAIVVIGAVFFGLRAGPEEQEEQPAPEQPAVSELAVAAEPDLNAVRLASERFRDVEVALAEGYIRDPFNICETADMMGKPTEDGAMGIHYFRPDLLGISGPPDPRVAGTGTHTDFLKPAILLYEPKADGTFELVGVENLVFADAWQAAGHANPPSFHGVPYDRMTDDPATPLDEAHMFEPHYDRHVWIHRDNPKGTFAPFNPNVSCEHHQASSPSHAAAASN